MLSASLYLGGVALLVIKLVNSGWGPGGVAAVLLGIFVAVAVVLLRFLVKRAPVLYWKED
jgi:membrane-bound ClpP family serine protease